MNTQNAGYCQETVHTWASTLTSSRLGLLAPVVLGMGFARPVQEIFYDDLDVLHVVFPWIVALSAIAFRLDGTINALNTQIEPA